MSDTVAGMNELIKRIEYLENKLEIVNKLETRIHKLVDTIILNQSIYASIDSARSDKIAHLENIVELLKMKIDRLL